jgi:hypothetical protein
MTADIPRTREAEWFLDSVKETILQRANEVRREDPGNQTSAVSPIDIITTLEKQQHRSRRRERFAFASQVFTTALVIAAVMILGSTALWAVRGQAAAEGRAVTSLFTTVTLALVTVMGATLIAFPAGENSGKVWSYWFRASRRSDEQALLEGWKSFESTIRHRYDESESNGARANLSAIIARFANDCGVEVNYARDILRVRNAVAYGEPRASRRELRRALQNLRRLRNLCDVSRSATDKPV